jgi:type I restriction enzyme S subunit
MNAQMFLENFGPIANAPNGVAKLREIILSLAMQGKLVKQNPQDTPASEMLKEIKAEKQRLKTPNSLLEAVEKLLLPKPLQ